MSEPDGITIEGDSVTLRASGIGRYFEAVFLGIWLTFWVIGEGLALAALGSMLLALAGVLADSPLAWMGRSLLNRAPGFEVGFTFVYLFLMLWVALWTLGGVAAGYTFLRLLCGSDRLGVSGGVLHLTRRAGPFWRTRRFDRERLLRIRVRTHDKAVVADVSAGTVTLTTLGTPAQRESVAEWLRRRLGLDVRVAGRFDPLAAPPGWRTYHGDTGAVHLSRPTGGRRRVAAGMGVIAIVALYAWLLDVRGNGVQSYWPVPVIALLSLAAAWVAWSREEWIIGHQQLDYRLRFGPYAKERTFHRAQLEVSSHRDSDGDAHYKLTVRDDDTTRTIASSVFDDTEVMDLARWLETATGFRLTT